ncbi:glycosyltransferase family 4 protein [Alkalihalophilus marmarensis]|uniref:glycosyltransferase family 4 protein n=1 Tax=Alkalihalophilus marmarensis TaxID=521377 RepID=UPI002E1ACB5E|nr:glycosyltransferase family 4 protein [Alkalihalophilus marmarensis]
MKRMINSIKRILFRDKLLLKQRAQTNNKVCMVVWNTFETDARVTKEAKSLVKHGKDVTVIAVHNPHKTKKREVVEGINVVRVCRTIRIQKDASPSPAAKSKAKEAQVKVNSNPSLKTRVKKKFVFVPKLIINTRFFLNAFKQNAGVYHSHDLNTFFIVYLVARLRGAALVYDAHEVSTDRAGWSNKQLWERLESFLIKRADKVITTNQTRADFFANKYRIETPILIRNVPPYQEIGNTNRIREQCGINKGVPVILYQGGIQRERGIENMVRCIPLVKKGTFVFIGNGALKPKIKSLVEEYNVHERVRFIDAVPNKELLSYTASADIGLQLLQNTCFNHYSACSNKLHEYLMAGIPVISSDLPEMRQVISTTNAGILVDPEDLQGVAEAINELVDNVELYNELKRNSKKASKLHQWDNEEVKLINLYQFN